MLIEALKPLTVRLPDRDVNLDPGHPVDFPDDQVSKLIERAPHKIRLVALPAGDIVDTATDPHQSVVAVKIVHSVIGDFWLCLSDTEPFTPDDGLHIYRPSEIRALAGKGYSPDDLQAVHRTKTMLEGKVIQ